MGFEDVLQEVTKTYASLLASHDSRFVDTTRALLRDAFQASSVREGGMYATLPAPGLQIHANWRLSINPEFSSYVSRNGEPVIPSEENGYVALEFGIDREDDDDELDDGGAVPRLTVYALSFAPKLPFTVPGTVENTPSSRNTIYALERGSVTVWQVDDDVRAGYLGRVIGDRKRNLALDVDDAHRVRWVRGPISTLGSGLLTEFLLDMGYTGLDKLLKK